MKRIVIVILLAVVFMLAGCMLFRYFVTDQIMDGGNGMTNEMAVMSEDSSE